MPEINFILSEPDHLVVVAFGGQQEVAFNKLFGIRQFIVSHRGSLQEIKLLKHQLNGQLGVFGRNPGVHAEQSVVHE